MDNLNETVAKNLIKFRQSVGYTQTQLAELLSYSDKSISKWERGDGLPDLNVLIKLSKIYHTSLDSFVSENDAVPASTKKHKHIFIAGLSILLVWFLAGVTFAILSMIPQVAKFAYMSFIVAIPCCGITTLIYSLLWGNQLINIISTSLILWGAIVSACLITPIPKIWIMCVAGGFFQLLIIFWYPFSAKYLHKNNANNH